MLKGHTKIILKDVATGMEEVHEDDNLVTAALDKIINIEMAFNHAPNTALLPLATNALGGIMLFDDELTESEDNFHFPTEAHLVGYANQGTNTEDKFRGSYNALESGKTATGFVSVWDFGTSQANGTIRAVARTHAHAGASPIYNYCGPYIASTSSGNPSTDTYWHPIRYDGEYLYMLKADSSSHTMRLARVRIPRLRMGVADFSNVERTYEVIASWNTHVTDYTYYSNPSHTSGPITRQVYADSPIFYEDGHDGYLYCINYGATASYNVYDYGLTYFTIHYGDGSYDKSDTVRVNLGVALYGYSDGGMNRARRLYGHVNDGVLYCMASNRKALYIVPLDTPASYRTVQIIQNESTDYVADMTYLSPRMGGVWFRVYHYATSSYTYRYGLLYPDGAFVLPDTSFGDGASQWDRDQYTWLRTCDDDLLLWAYGGDTYVYCSWAPNYLGTINNLSQAIAKTQAQTMKIVYTLTDDTGD